MIIDFTPMAAFTEELKLAKLNLFLVPTKRVTRFFRMHETFNLLYVFRVFYFGIACCWVLFANHVVTCCNMCIVWLHLCFISEKKALSSFFVVLFSCLFSNWSFHPVCKTTDIHSHSILNRGWQLLESLCRFKRARKSLRFCIVCNSLFWPSFSIFFICIKLWLHKPKQFVELHAHASRGPATSRFCA